LGEILSSVSYTHTSQGRHGRHGCDDVVAMTDFKLPRSMLVAV
jgi:hypothetical protein